MAAVSLHGVQLLIETHDEWMASDHLQSVMKAVDSKAVGILWDTHHPYRMLGESPSVTCKKLGKWIRYTHWKDSITKPDAKEGHKLCLVGEGDIPLRDILGALKTCGYDGYLTLEWEKLWCREIEEPGIAFPKYVKYMRKLLSDLQVL